MLLLLLLSLLPRPPTFLSPSARLLRAVASWRCRCVTLPLATALG